MAVGQHILARARIDARSFTGVDAAVCAHGSGFTSLGLVNGGLHIQLPRVEQIQITPLTRQQMGIGQTRAIVFGGEFGNIYRRFHRGLQRSRREITAGSIAFAAAHIHSDVKRFFLLVFQLLDFLQTHADRLTYGFADPHIGRSCPTFFGIIQSLTRQIA